MEFKRKAKPIKPIIKPVANPVQKKPKQTTDVVSVKGKTKGNGKLLPLTPSEKIFADEWLIDRNGVKAYQKAYPRVKNYNTAGVCAFQLLKKPKIAKYINKALAKLSATSRIDQEWVLKRYEMLADYCIDDFFNDDGTMKKFSEIPREKLYAIGGFKQSKKTITTKDKRIITERIKEFKLPSKRSTLDSVAKYLKMFSDEDPKGNINFNGPTQIIVKWTDED